MEEAGKIYGRYVERGLSMNPPFKGYGHGDHPLCARGAEPLRLLFLRRRDTAEFPPTENHSADIRRAIRETFSLTDAQADELHRHLWIYVHGLCTLIVTGVNDIPDTEAARLLGEVCRALLIAQRVPRDARTAIVPGKKVDAGGARASISPSRIRNKKK